MQWYYSKNGSQLGPISTEEILTKVGSGEIAPGDLVWKEGMADWVPAGQVGELRTRISGAPATGHPDPTGVPTAAPLPYTPPLAAPGGAVGLPPSQTMAIVSLVLGIIGFLSCCIWCLSGPLCIAAIVLGHIAFYRAKTTPVAFGGKGLAKWGLITGYLGLVGTVICTIFLAWFGTLTSEELERMEFLPPEVRQEMLKQRQQHQEELQSRQLGN